MSGPCCAVGARPDAGEIDAALRAGDGLGTIVKRFKLLAKSSLGVHRARCLGITVQRASSEQSRLQDEASKPGSPDGGKGSDRQEKEVAVGPSLTVQKVARARPSSGAAAPTRPGGVQTPVQGRPWPPEEAPRTDDEHVQAIADQMADGEWVGRRSVREYANQHGLRRGKVKDFARAAALVCYADEEQIEQRRQPALGRWLKLYEEAMVGNEKGPDFKAAALALTGYDRAAGVIQPSATKVEVNVMQVPQVGLFANALIAFVDAACPPESAVVAREWLRALSQDDELAKADPAGWVAARRRQVVEALPADGEEGEG